MPLPAMLGSVGFTYETSPTYDFHGLKRGRAEFALFQYTVQGSGRLRVEGVTHEVVPGQAILLRFPHDNRYWLPPGGAWEFLYVCLHGAEVMRLWPGIIKGLGSLAELAPKSTPVRIASRLVASALDGQLEDPFAASSEAYALLMALAAAVRQPPADSPHAAALELARQHGEEHFMQPLDVGTLAEVAGLSRYHFTRLFSAHVGASPAAWLSELRLREAARLLRTTNCTIKDIAARCGFADVHYFGKLFHRRTGQPPAAYRRSGA